MPKTLSGRVAMSGLATGASVLAAVGTFPQVHSERALLGIYLNDHLLGATFGTELAARSASTQRDSPRTATLVRLAAEIAEDRDTLLEIMAVLGVPVRRYKVLAGWLAEKTGRLKMNGHLLRRSALSDLEELEVMRLGVEGKNACWRTLRTLADRDDRLDAGWLDDLMARAKRQANALDELRVLTADEFVPVL